MNKSSLKKYIIITVVILLSLYIILTIVSFLYNPNGKLASPKAKIQGIQIATPSPNSNQPQEIKYDVSSDLKKELQTVNPEVLDSDFAL